jgi:hypothetical protein
MATATKTVKAPNYTVEQTAKMVADYKAGVSTAAIAEALGKGVKSVVAKLSREGVYQAKVYVSKTGEPVQKKDDTADAIGAVLKLSENDTTSLAKANKSALRAIFVALANSVPLDDALTETERASLMRVNKATRERVFAALAAVGDAFGQEMTEAANAAE